MIGLVNLFHIYQVFPTSVNNITFMDNKDIDLILRYFFALELPIYTANFRLYGRPSEVIKLLALICKMMFYVCRKQALRAPLYITISFFYLTCSYIYYIIILPTCIIVDQLSTYILLYICLPIKIYYYFITLYIFLTIGELHS